MMNSLSSFVVVFVFLSISVKISLALSTFSDYLKSSSVSLRDNEDKFELFETHKKSSDFHSETKHSEFQDLLNDYSRSSSIVKTGTTIVGVCCRDGVVLGADTRTTGGSLVMNKNKRKIHAISKYIYCCTAGTVADCDNIVRKARYDLSLQRLQRFNTISPADHDVVDSSPDQDNGVVDDKMLSSLGQDNNDATSSSDNDSFDLISSLSEDESYENIHSVLTSITHSFHSDSSKPRQPEAVFILGGVDSHGNECKLFSIDHHGFASQTAFCALGSGSTKAYSILETEISSLCNETLSSLSEDNAKMCVDITVEEGVKMVRKAVFAGIQNDLGSGSHIDLVTIVSSLKNVSDESHRNSRVKLWREEINQNQDSLVSSDASSDSRHHEKYKRDTDLDSSDISLDVLGKKIEYRKSMDDAVQIELIYDE